MDNEDIHPCKRMKVDPADRHLNFSISPEECEMLCVKKPKIPRDPMSHRIIEKRRRDRMNNCLADLSRLIPSNYLKQGQGRIEKTEIIEMATRHISHLQKLNKLFGENEDMMSHDKKQCCKGKFYLGFKDCQDEVMRFFVEQEGWEANDPLCCKIMLHLSQSSSKFISSASGKTSNPCGMDDVIITDECSNQSLSTSDQGSYLMSDSGKYSVHPEMSPLKHKDNSEGYISDFQQHNNSHMTLVKPEDGCLGALDEACLTYTAQKVHENSASYPNRQEYDSCNSSDFSSVSKTNAASDFDQSGSNVYKFKHNITKRFSQEEKHHNPTEARETRNWHSGDGVSKPNRKVSRHQSRSPSSDDTVYPDSSHSSDGVERRCKTSLKLPNTSSTPLPAFVLHPKGTHYIPLSIHPSHIKNILPKESLRDNSSLPAFHPISIPVNFSGPCVSIKNFCLQPSCSVNGEETAEQSDQILQCC
ncbi:uncharacterized protein LOC117330938 [Pecten maximus]|uniref:uncharacterized protein LOC117330938 n=1 Tax=Pecten maximus TaxID=6579 RepID=UPI001457F5A5|nr:uncharacterized protein LOC117330938 [Pecten maximus]